MVIIEFDEIEKEKVRGLLSECLTHQSSKRVDILDFRYEPAKPKPQPTKSKIYKISHIDFDTEGTIELPPSFILKKYLNKQGRASGINYSPRDEYRIEKAILSQSESLIYELDKRAISIYPRFFSKGIPGCDDEMCIVREFVREKTIEELANELRNTGGLKWENVNELLYTIALHHAKSSFLINVIPSLPQQNIDHIKKAFRNRVFRIARNSGRMVTREGIGEAIDEPYLRLVEEYFVGDKASRFSAVINGDLDTFAHHCTLHTLLDAGSVQIGSFLRDLAMYTHPAFNGIENIERLVAEDYHEIRGRLEEDLQHKEFEVKPDDIMKGFCMAGFNGNLRHAASAIFYMLPYIPKEFELNDLNERVRSALSNCDSFLRKFMNMAGNKEGRAASRLYDVLHDLGLYEGYKIDESIIIGNGVEVNMQDNSDTNSKDKLYKNVIS